MDTVKFDKKAVKMVAHRGLSGIERENTCPAFVAAGNRSYFGIETDIHVTRDGQMVVIHDETTERVTGGKVNINVEECDYAAVRDLVLPDLDGSLNRGDIRVPLLVDYIKICKKYGKTAVLELKNPFICSDIVKVIDIIKGEDYLGNVIFISFSFENCRLLRDLLPMQKIQWLTYEELSEERLRELVRYGLDLDIYYKLLNEDLVKMLHDKGILVNCWTCDDRLEAEKLASWGVDFITSNILE